jgi:hypothetical protein
LLSKKNLIALTGLPLLLGVLYLELWLTFWLPWLGHFFGGLFLMTALVGAYVWSMFLPHPRQERKRREAELRLEVQKVEESLAEKRP